MCVSNDLGNAVPMAGRRFGPGAVGPEQGDLRLIFCACRANSRPELLDLLVISCVLLAIERGRTRRPKLRAAVHREWSNKSPLRQQIRSERRRSRYPHAWRSEEHTSELQSHSDL